MSDRKLLALDMMLLGAVLVVVVGLALVYNSPWKRTVVVWSCGGNFHGLEAFGRKFEKQYGCRVRYTAAPVEYLLERAVFTDKRPDILVGRAGPGWVALQKVNKIEHGPTFFAADPYVIIVAPGNPLHIKGPADLGKPGVRVCGSRYAMRPKGKCAGHLMETASRKLHPGLDERWEINTASLGGLRCGRELTDPIIQGKADAALGYLSMTTYPGARGRVEAIPVAPKYIRPMTSCKATVGQCLCVLRNSRDPELARLYHDELLSEMGRQTLEEHGYIHVTSPAVKPYNFLLSEIQVPRRMPPWQVHLADRLAADGIQREGLRRYLTAIHGFGPGSHDAYCRYRVGELLAEQGRPAQAAVQWRRLLRDFPRPTPQEYLNRAFDIVEEGPELTEEPESHWVAEGRRRLAELPRQARNAEAVRGLPPWLPTIDLEPPEVSDGDPGKNGKRELCLAEDLFLAGDYEFASRDYLKVLTLCYPSRHMPQASFKLGLCQYLRGNPAMARQEWERTVAQFADSQWAQYARKGLDNLPQAQPPPQSPMPSWELAYETWPQRGMSYGMELYRHRLPRFAFKEMIKLIHDEYGPNKLKAQARYRAGIAAVDLGEPKVAALQWRLCAHDHAGDPWARRSQRALSELVSSGRLSKDVTSRPLPRIAQRKKPPCYERFAIAEEFFHAGMARDEETVLEYLKVLTVTRASPGGYDEAIVPRAQARLVQCLAQMGHLEAAQRHRLEAEKQAKQAHGGKQGPRR